MTPAVLSSSATALVVALARSSYAPAHPTQNRYSHVGGNLFLAVGAEHRHLEVDFFDQALRRGCVHAPRVALLLDVLEQPAEFGWELRLDHDLVAAHVDEVIDVLDVHRALLDTGATRGARPQGIGVDDRALVAAVTLRVVAVGLSAGSSSRAPTSGRWISAATLSPTLARTSSLRSPISSGLPAPAVASR